MPIEASSGSGKATSENCVMGSGQTLLIITSTSDVEDEAARIAANDEKFCGSAVDLVIELEFSFSMVCFVKCGDENPWFRHQRKVQSGLVNSHAEIQIQRKPVHHKPPLGKRSSNHVVY